MYTVKHDFQAASSSLQNEIEFVAPIVCGIGLQGCPGKPMGCEMPQKSSQPDLPSLDSFSSCFSHHRLEESSESKKIGYNMGLEENPGVLEHLLFAKHCARPLRKERHLLILAANSKVTGELTLGSFILS